MYVEVEHDVHIYVHDINPGSGGATIVFVHGWPLNHKMFDYQFNVLPQHGFRCIGIDLRGYGQSDKPWGSYAYNRLADDLFAVLQALQLENIILLGFSVGGAVSIRYMSRYKGRHIAKLVLVDAAFPSFVKQADSPYGISPEQANILISQIYANRPKFLHDLSLMFFNRNLGPDMLNWFVALSLEAAPYATIKILQELAREDVTNDLSSIAVPTAVFHGVHDQVIPFESGRLTQNRITGATLYPLNNSGHGSPIEQADAFNAALIQFLAQS
ncbi:alpha/beta fold hydrolase [Sporolactobacillus pectinivorans]|uniref:alpha/beta fold hydrolase n=1 Tax=Sporolactobacillus pectinivorans TaxID=1591408 RepID=UPI000C26546F|nr:alpha/beta hydrolase [Sporolactobacillus pectinivorans]